MTAGRLFQHALPHPTVPALRILQPTGLANDHIQKPRAEGGEPRNETMGVREATVPQGLPLGSQGWLCLYSRVLVEDQACGSLPDCARIFLQLGATQGLER